MDRKKWLEENFVVCQCGYFNNKRAVDFYGNCICCGRILNDRAWFKRKLVPKIKVKGDEICLKKYSHLHFY